MAHQHLEEHTEHDDRGWIVTCACGWKSDPQPTEDEATNEHSAHANAMMREENDA